MPSSIIGAPCQIVRAHRPWTTAHAPAIGFLSSTQRLDFAIGLPLRNRAALTNLLQEIYRPGNLRNRRYLTPGEFAARFGPTEEDYATVVSFARANGFTVTATHPNRLLLSLRGDVASIESALHVRMVVHRHPIEHRTFFAPDSDPSPELAVPVADFCGLDNFAPPRPMSLHRTALIDLSAQTTPAAGTGSASGAFFGRDFRAAYLPGATLDGIGESVGLVQFDGFYPADIATYKSLAGLPNVPVNRVLLDGFNGMPGDNNSEVALDIELSIAMAPGLSQVLVYEGAIPNDVLNRIATDNQARQISCSWGWSGYGGEATTEAILLQFAAQGQSFFVASGDSDAYVLGDTIYAPADDPNAVSVGGTTLTTGGAGGPWVAESVWNWNNGYGSSGGVSTNHSLPSWQQGIDFAACHGSTAGRNFPDVAMVANNVLVVYNNGTLGTFGGTSCAAPLWAGLAAVINQQAAINGLPPLGFLNPALYALGKRARAPAVFHDITVGNNFSGSSPTNFAAMAGYDLCTGWGTPTGSNLVNALAPANLLLNGGFETGDFTGWTMSGGYYDPVHFFSVIGSGDMLYDFLASATNGATGSLFVRSGSYGALLGEYGSVAYLSQTFATTPGQPYLVSAWLAYPYAGTPNELQVLWNGTVLFDRTNLDSFDWTNLTFTVLATNATSTFAFGARCDPNAFALDDIYLEALPRPVIQSISRQATNIVWAWETTPGATYQPQYTASLGATNWTSLGAPVMATDAIATVTDPAPPPTQRFYRVVFPL